MKESTKISFAEFLEYFPIVDLPITLTDESVHHFSKNNKILPPAYTEEYISPHLATGDPEYREIIPCFRIPDTHDFHGLVFWEGGLMNYQFNLVSFNKRGEYISGKVIAGTIASNNNIQQTVATIDTEWMIHFVTGINAIDAQSYEAQSSKAFTMELLADGEIIFSLDD